MIKYDKEFREVEETCGEINRLERENEKLKERIKFLEEVLELNG